MVVMDRDETVSSRVSTGYLSGSYRHLPYISGAISGTEPRIHIASVGDV
jgi:hypothetical protein